MGRYKTISISEKRNRYEAAPSWNVHCLVADALIRQGTVEEIPPEVIGDEPTLLVAEGVSEQEVEKRIADARKQLSTWID